MNFNLSEFGNFSRPTTDNHRQGKILGPLIGFFLASFFPNLAIAKLQQGSIRFQYDPLPVNPIINIYQANSTPHHQPLEPIIFSQHHQQPLIHQHEDDFGLPTSPYEYLVPPKPPQQKYLTKRAISSRYNRFTTTNNRRRFPEYDYYDYPLRIKNNNNIRRRNQGRRPLFDYEYDFSYDYDYGNKNKKRKQQQKRRNNKNKQPNRDYYDDNYDDDDEVERVTSFKPRQQQQQDTTTTPATTTMPTTTMPSTTIIQNGSTPAPNNSTGYGYGPYSGNENISITYGPPSAIKPVYGVPEISYGWVPNSYLYETPSSTSYLYGIPSSSSSYSSVSYASPSYSKPAVSYGPPSTSYGVPSQSYGTPSTTYGVPSQAYGTPSTTYGAPSTTYGVPSTSYGVPSSSYGVPSSSYGVPSQTVSSQAQSGSRVAYQSYQLPFSGWYGRSGGGSQPSDSVRRFQDLF